MSNEFQNRLALEKSPYLVQHAHNPVDWYPWGNEAFEKAKREDKPIFLSIGYSTCHWCHVMAHESFEDPQTGRLINDNFIPIKVDREERPDIDMIYMKACQMLTGTGGWPLTIIVTPDKEPFFAATYIPRETKFGRIGLLELIPHITEVWKTRRNEVMSSAAQIAATLRSNALPEPGEEPGETTLHTAYKQLKERFDEEYAGFGKGMKFPTPHNMLFLLRYWKRTGDNDALNMVEQTLQSMRNGGIYDQIGFGFHRYSTDRKWLVPHFEKMLYDQALIAMAYIEAYQATGKAEYTDTAREIFAYVLRDLTDARGGFYSAEDSDSEGEEGKFYLWKYSEIRQILKPEDTDLFCKVFNIKEDGNYTDEIAVSKTSRNIPHLTKSLNEFSTEHEIAESELKERMESIRQQLFVDREKRIHPHKDDKILTDWNGLMIAALARGASVLNEPDYAAAAKRAVDFILDTMIDSEGQLLHRYRDGETAIPANLDDCAFLIYGLIELYESTFEVNYMKKALELNEYLMQHFWDGDNGGFYFTTDQGEPIIIRQKEIYDGAVPSGNSIAMLNMLRLARITANPDLEDKASRIGRVFYENVSQLPSAFTRLMVAIDFAIGPSYELIIAGDPQASDTKEILQAVYESFIPNKIMIFIEEGPTLSEIQQIAEFTGNYTAINGQATAYVCVNHTCNLPTTNIDTMKSLLNAG